MYNYNLLFFIYLKLSMVYIVSMHLPLSFPPSLPISPSLHPHLSIFPPPSLPTSLHPYLPPSLPPYLPTSLSPSLHIVSTECICDQRIEIQ